MITDLHSHILPRIDDGSCSVEESIAMLRMEARQGIRRVVATPHFYPGHDTPDAFLERRARAEVLLRRGMEEIPGLPILEMGAEVYFFRGMSESESLKKLSIFDNRCILVELPDGYWDDGIYRELAAIWENQKLIPIVAHIDRYIAPFRTRGVPQKLAKLPVMVQANAGFFLNRNTTGLALRMLKADQIQLLGSDCHNTTDRAPELGQAVEVIRNKLGTRPLARIRRYERKIMGVQSARERMECL